MSGNRGFFDDPIEIAQADRLGRAPFVQQLATVLTTASRAGSSSVYGLVGPWGSGKSSVLKLLSLRLQSSPEPWRIVEFNPWSYSDETSMQLGFFGELRSALPKRGQTGKARKALGNLSTSVAPLAGIIGGFAGVDGSAIASNLGQILIGDASASKAFKDASLALRRTTTPILMIIDDLDRLDPQELVLVAKLVRLVGRLPNVYYLLSYDEGTLLDVLSRTPLVGGKQSRAKDYLEKIIQMRFDLPPLRTVQASDLVESNIEKFEERVGVKLDEVSRQRFTRAYEETLSSRLQTVRGVNRFFAQLELLTPNLAPDVDLADFILVTWLRVFEPRLYSAIYTNRSWALGTRTVSLSRLFSSPEPGDGAKRHKELLDRITLAGVDSEHINDVAILLGTLFPALRSDLVEQQSRFTPAAVSGSQRRIADPDYFDRYFAYLVPEEDVSDGVVNRGLTALHEGLSESLDLNALAAALESHGTLTARKIQSQDPDPILFAGWIATILPHAVKWAGDEGHVVSRLLQWNVLRLSPAHFEDAVRDLCSSVAGRVEVIRLGTYLRRGRDTTAMYARAPLSEIEAFWRHLCDVLPPILVAELDRQLPDSALNASPTFMEMLWLQEDITPGTAKTWLRDQRVAGRWRLLDELARLVHGGSTSERPGVAILDHLTEEDFDAYFDPDEVASGLNAELASAPELLEHDWNLEDTAENRRSIALDDARRYLAKRRVVDDH